MQHPQHEARLGSRQPATTGPRPEPQVGIPRESPRNALASQWLGRIEAQQRSGLSVSAWCRANGVVPVTFYSWRRRLAAEMPNPPARFVELMPSPATACPPLELRLRRGGRVTLILRRGFDTSLLREALAALQAEEPRR